MKPTAHRLPKLVFALALLSAPALGLNAQTESLALKEFSERMQALETIRADFTFTLENRRENITDTHAGTLQMKGRKYRLELMGMEVYFDGTTRWQYIPEANEVTISTPSAAEGGFLDDPTQMFRDLDKNFRSRFIGQTALNGRAVYEVDLYPVDLTASFSILKLHFDRNSLDPVRFRYQGKDGINFIIEVESFRVNAPIRDDVFTFNPTQRRNIVVVDLR